MRVSGPGCANRPVQVWPEEANLGVTPFPNSLEYSSFLTTVGNPNTTLANTTNATKGLMVTTHTTFDIDGFGENEELDI